MNKATPVSIELRASALAALIQSDLSQKLATVRALSPVLIDTEKQLSPNAPLPGRPERPALVSPRAVKVRSPATREGRAALLHAIAHIEFNAINLALDIIWRFPQQPKAFYQDWLRVAKEEVYHFSLIHAHLQSLGYRYGDFPAHNGLWEMCEKTKDHLLARLALVPRTLEARGLDVNPAMQAKLAQAGDFTAVAILNIILRDEVGHVAIGNRWYKALCQDQDPVQIYTQLLAQYQAPLPRGPFNIADRQRAGFSPEEIQWLQSLETSYV